MKKAKLSIILAAAALLIGAAAAFFAARFAIEAGKEKNTKLTIWEAPKSMHVASDLEMSVGSENARPMELALSPWVKCAVNGHETPVYETNDSNSHADSVATPNQSRTPVVYFDFDGVVHVEVEVSKPEVTSVELRPYSANITPVLENGKISFTLDQPGDYSLVFNDSPERAMHFFTSYPETETYEEGSDDVVYYGPGEYDAGVIDLQSGQTLYLAGGAVVHGNIRVENKENVKILGRGIIDGSLYGGDSNNRVVRIPVDISQSKNVSLEGILILNPNGWCVQGYSSTDVTIKNIAIISSRANGDGITLQSCVNFDVSDAFVRSWDDSLVVKNYAGSTDNIVFHDIQIWTDLAQSMEIGFETNKGSIENAEIKNIVFRDITVLYNLHKPVMSIHNGDSCLVHDVLYENITVEHADMSAGSNLFEFTVLESGWSTTPERGDIRDVKINGVNVLSTTHRQLSASVSGFGKDHTVENVSFGNVVICGEPVTSGAGPLRFDIEDKNTAHITIVSEGK